MQRARYLVPATDEITGELERFFHVTGMLPLDWRLVPCKTRKDGICGCLRSQKDPNMLECSLHNVPKGGSVHTRLARYVCTMVKKTVPNVVFLPELRMSSAKGKGTNASKNKFVAGCDMQFDLVCVTADGMLVFEFDGASHLSKAARVRDSKKEEFLAREGIALCRIKFSTSWSSHDSRATSRIWNIVKMALMENGMCSV